MWKTWKKFLLNLFLPQFCLGCSKEGSLICEDCLSAIEIVEYCYCPFCKKPLRLFGASKCRSHQKMNLDGLFFATDYQNPLVKTIIRKFKYEPFLKSLAVPLAYLIIAHFKLSQSEAIFEPANECLFTAVPASNFKKRWRGYNPAEEIGRLTARYFKIPFSSSCLKKTKSTPSQARLRALERQKNIAGAFQAQETELVANKKIFLIDDVFTTGATMEECARVLKEAGAKQVWGIAAARERLLE